MPGSSVHGELSWLIWVRNFTIDDCLSPQDPTGQVTFKHGDKTHVGKITLAHRQLSPLEMHVFSFYFSVGFYFFLWNSCEIKFPMKRL
jgi:hypothetical protein